MTLAAALFRGLAARRHCGLFRAGRLGRALTIVELVLSLAITALLLAGVASAMVIAARVIPAAGAPLRPASDGAFAIDRMLIELQTAQTFSEISAKAVTAVVADITGDSADDTVRYAWSGTRDAPLTRQINGGTVVNLLPSVRGFAFGFSPYTKTTTTPQVTTNTSASQTISSFNGWVGVTIPVAQSWDVSTNAWVAIQFRPYGTVPYDAKSVTISSVSFNARGTGAAANLYVGVYPTKPDNLYLATPLIGMLTIINAATIGTGGYSTITAPLTNAVLDNPFAGYVVRFSTNTASVPVTILGWYGALIAPANDTVGEQSPNRGGNWSPTSDIDAYDAPHTITGTYTTETRSYVADTRYYLRAITAAAVASDGTALQQSQALLNEPDVTGLWTPALDSNQSLIDEIVTLVGNVVRP